MQTGDVLEALVTGIESYGAWVSVENKRILVKLTDITWDTFGVQVDDYVSVGDKIRVKIRDIDGENIFASIKDVYPDENPWLAPPKVGDTFKAKVVLVAEYGYILLLRENTYGLLHTDLASGPYEKSQYVLVKVSKVDIEKRVVSCYELNVDP